MDVYSLVASKYSKSLPLWSSVQKSVWLKHNLMDVRGCIFREILVEESNVQRVDSPVTVSNIH